MQNNPSQPQWQPQPQWSTQQPQPPGYPPQSSSQWPAQQPGVPLQPPQSPYPQQPQWQPSGYPPTPPKKRKIGVVQGCAIAFGIFLVLGVISGILNGGIQSLQKVPTVAVTNASTPIGAKITPTPQPNRYPPKTLADLHALAAQGDANAIHEFHSESVGLVGVCPQPKREVTVDPHVTGQQLTKDLLAYFYAQQLNNPCGSLVLVYHNQGEANDVYTAGLMRSDVSDSSGAVNTDPNATSLKYKLTLDIGGFDTHEEYVVTY